MAVADVNLHQPLILNGCGNILPAPTIPYGARRYGLNRNFRRVGAGCGCGSSLIGGAAYGDDLSYTGTGLGDVGYNISSWYGLPVDYVSGTAGLTNANLATINYLSTPQATGLQQYATDVQGFYGDYYPRLVRRRVLRSGVPYKKNIGVRYLRPRSGPLIIRGVRPRPLRISRQVLHRSSPPPLIIREQLLTSPVPFASQTCIQRVPALPLPPRSIPVGRLPPLPPRPQTVILEKWLPFRRQARRRVIVQRAPPPRAYPRPRNIVIQYEPTPARVNQRIRFLGVTQGDPQAYVQHYGGSLLDAHSLEQIARAAGVVENISPSVLAGSIAANSYQFASRIVDYWILEKIQTVSMK
ncbi:unnamed protein product [Rotaria sordida]|uniref:Uncharacterized protein n=1 Tax=Rotaria sordida TaxID=392033 RepID=A0A815QFV7_9BILA|nr:unnamed protein product [Rotaria sordida]CAF1642163.1 unnamed protein product [Rotaria sordida]